MKPDISAGLDGLAIAALAKGYKRFGPRKSRWIARMLLPLIYSLHVDEDAKASPMQVQLAEQLAGICAATLEKKPHVPKPRSIWKQQPTPPEKLVPGSKAHEYALKAEAKRRAEAGAIDCAYCGDEIRNARVNQRFCSPACRNRGWREQ